MQTRVAEEIVFGDRSARLLLHMKSSVTRRCRP
jgi:hypothetical protein